MTTAKILDTLERAGAMLSVEDGKLKALDPCGAITNELSYAFGMRKAEIVALLTAEEVAATASRRPG